MQRVVIVAPSASSGLPPSPDASASSDAIGWLGAALAQRGWRVTVLDEGNVAGEIARTTYGVTADEVLLVHLSGRLTRRGVLRAGGGRWLAVREVGTALAALACKVCVVAELLYEGEASDELSAEHVASVVAAMGAREHGFTMVTVARPATSPAGPLAFSRLLLDVTSFGRETSLTAACYRVISLGEGRVAAQGFTIVRGKADFSLAPPEEPSSAVPSTLDPSPTPSMGPPSLDGAIDAATDARDWPRVIELRRARLPTIPAAQTRARELVTIARILQAEMGQAEAAIEALEQACELAPMRVGVLQALRRGYEKVGRWASAIEVVSALSTLEQSGPARAELRVSLAAMVGEHLQDHERAASLLEAALRDDPSNAAAMSALLRLRHAAAAPDMAEPAEFAEEESTGELPIFRDSVPPSRHSPDAKSDPLDPLDPATHEFVFEQRRLAGQLDGAYLSALALEELRAARPEHLGLIEARRTTSPVRPRAPLDAAAWARIRARGSDDILEALFGAVSRAGAVARVEQLIARDRLVALDPSARIEDGSTTSVWRTFQWAAQVLAVPCPAIYVVDEVPGEIAAVRAAEPSTAVGATVVGGRSAKELAFLAGRHLTYYRSEHQVLLYFPTHDELERLLFASIELVLPGSTCGTDSRAVSALQARLERHVTPGEQALIADAALRLHARGGQASLVRWACSVELTAGHAGLFLCGDLGTATAVVDGELRGIAGLTGEDRRRDLIEFAGSDAHAALRAEYLFLD